MSELTDIEDWKRYWADFEPNPIEKVYFDKIIMDLPSNSKLLEIGGFPGNFAAHFKKVKNCDVTVLDFYIDPIVIRKVEEANNILPGSIKFIKGDFLKLILPEKFDIVCSFGFLEHFNDTINIIEKHLMLLKKGGTLLITIPNFRGINGLIQKIYHYENYKKHNIECMNIKTLKLIVQKLNLKSYQIDFLGDPCVWIEKDAHASRKVYFLIKKLNKILTKIPFKKNYFLAPHIFLKIIKA